MSFSEWYFVPLPFIGTEAAGGAGIAACATRPEAATKLAHAKASVDKRGKVMLLERMEVLVGFCEVR